MKFAALDERMRAFEQSLDQELDPALYLAARIDGRGFTRLTKEICPFEAPFDAVFRDYMVETVRHLMTCGFRVVYGYTQSDEISLLFHKDENSFGRRVRKYNSILAGEASAKFSVQLGMPAAFDCRMIPLPDVERVCDYFLWRQEDALRNALNAHCYWTLRKEGLAARTAAAQLEGQSTDYKVQLLLARGIRFDSLPAWQKRGVGLYFAQTEKEGFNPVTGERTNVCRSRIQTDSELPVHREYAEMIRRLIRGE